MTTTHAEVQAQYAKHVSDKRNKAYERRLRINNLSAHYAGQLAASASYVDRPWAKIVSYARSLAVAVVDAEE